MSTLDRHADSCGTHCWPDHHPRFWAAQLVVTAEAFAWQRDDPRSKSTLLAIRAITQQLGVQPTSAARNVSDDSRVG